MLNTETSSSTEFWSDIYGGRAIAVFQHHGRWLVLFRPRAPESDLRPTSEDAIAWLTHRIDQGVPARLH